jgi:DNA-binding transcriptional LysR family regulator
MYRVVPQALVTFLREHPDADVDVRESRTPNTLRLLAEGAADLGVVIDHEVGGGDVRTEPLGDDSLVVIGQAGGILAGRTSLAYREAAEHPLVGLDADSSLRRWIDANIGPHAPAARFRTTVADINVLVALAAAGVGLAIAPRRAVEGDPRLDVCALEDPWSRRNHLLAWGAKDPTPSVAALAEHVRAAAGAP